MEWHDLGIDVRGKSRGQIKVPCPKCGPTSRNRRKTDLSVDLDRGLYNCHNDGCDFHGRIGSAPDWRDWQPAPVYVRPEVPVATERRLGPNARKFFLDRSIDPETAERLGVYSNPEDTAIAIPFTRAGEVVHIKYRALDTKRFWSSKDSEPVFYNLDRCERAEYVCITEGEMDVMALMSVGVSTAMSLPNGAPGPGQNADGKLACMASGEEIFAQAERIVIAVDNDAPGRALADELIRRLGRAKCYVAEWPEGCKDANDVLMQHGPERLAECVHRARPVPISGIIYANDVREDVWRNRHGRSRQGVEVEAWPTFNEHFRLGEAQLVTVTGTPSSGKSAFLQALTVNVANADPSWTFAYFTPEQAPAEDWYDQMVRLKLGATVDRVTRQQYDEAYDWVHHHFILQAPEEPTLSNILDLGRVLVMRHGIKGVIIDPYTEVETPRPAGVGESEHVGNNLAKIRAFGQRHQTCMVIAAHPVKPDRLAQDKPVGPYDISGSANWFNKSDMMISVFRHDRTLLSSPVDVHIQKVRKRQFGKVGMASFGFHIESGRYYEIDYRGER